MNVLAASPWLDKVLAKVTGDPAQILALVGQIIFGGRFLVQWLASEKHKRVVIPPSFWWMSIVGSALLLLFFVVKAEPVMILAFSANSAIYVRNLFIHKRSLDVPAVSA
jgi:lipid-A-disaccharide synthase-like uncharacterized protein